jgi:O-antigen ligase
MTGRLPFISLFRHWFFHNIHIWLRFIVIAGVLLVSLALPFVISSQRNLMVLIGLPFGIGAVLLFMRWPPLGLLALIGSIIIPFNGPSNSNATLAAAGLLLGLWLSDMMVIQRKIQLPASLPIRPLLALIVVACLAFGLGQLPWYTFAQPAPLGAQLGGLAMYVLSAVVFLLAATQLRELRWLEWMTWLFLALGAIFIAGRLVYPIGRFTESYMFSPQATGSLFWTWLTVLAFSQAAFNKKLHLVWRAALAMLTMATLYVGLVQGWAWNSGWVPSLAAVVGILWAATPRLGLLATLVGLAGGTTKLGKLTSLVMVGDNSYSLSTRLDAWKIIWEIAKVNPILGLGPANYHWYTPLFPIRGWAVKFNSHSQYVDLIAQTGVLGLTCFLWFFGAVGWLGWQLRSRVPEGFPRAYVYGAIGGVVGTLTAAALGDWVIPFFYNINLGGFRASMLSWLFLGGLVALEQIYKHSPSLHIDEFKRYIHS